LRQTRRHHLVLLATTVAIPLLPAPRLRAQTASHEIAMLNADPENRRRQMVFRPAVLRVQPGDTVRFVPVDRGHNAQSLDGMTPEGAAPFRSRINEPLELTLTVDGIYGYVCQPHATMGMMGLILCGNFTVNLEAVRAAGRGLRGRASTERFAEYLAEAEAIAAAEGLT
jgi:pseudoazurin